MTHDECQTLLVALLYQELDAGQASQVREHLAGCQDCARSYAELQGTLEFVDRLPLEAPAPAVEDAIMTAARAEADRRAAGSGQGWLLSPHLAMAAAAMLVIGVGVYAGFPFLVREVVMEDEATPVAAPAAPAESDALEEERAVTDSTDEVVAPGMGSPKETVLRADRTLEQNKAQPKKVAKQAERKRRVKRAAPTAVAKSEPVGSKRIGRAATRGASSPDALSGLRGGGMDSRAEAEVVAFDRKASATDDRSAVSTEASSDLLARARALSAKDDCLGAVKVYERFIKKYPKDPATSDAKLETGLCYRRLGRIERARYWLREASKDQAVAKRANRELDEIGSAKPAKPAADTAASEPASQ